MLLLRPKKATETTISSSGSIISTRNMVSKQISAIHSYFPASSAMYINLTMLLTKPLIDRCGQDLTFASLRPLLHARGTIN